MAEIEEVSLSPTQQDIVDFISTFSSEIIEAGSYQLILNIQILFRIGWRCVFWSKDCVKVIVEF